MVNWFCCHTQFCLFPTFLNTFFFANMLHVYLRLSSMIFCILSMLQQQHPVLLFFFSFIHIILCFALLNLCSYHVSTKKHNRVNKEKQKKKKKRIRDTKQWCSVNAFFISRHYRCVAISYIHIYEYTYIGKSIENVAPKRWKMTICMPSNWFACHFIHTVERDSHYSHLYWCYFLTWYYWEYCRLSSFITFIWHSRMMPAYRKYFHVFNMSRKKSHNHLIKDFFFLPSLPRLLQRFIFFSFHTFARNAKINK